ncbi:transmembrane anti-sigma factor [Microbacterium sp. CH12i]|uniref:zf-HC2 domain-containing protein n=1 Tax=Microbacterium sp. CH12i TaxID=1479651 RepID=UPI000461C81A|nr:zf-HC2 domain-containing protein [Microbacterium sp. CH12i]KDA06537.1 transmembrane anti-sigma factor [Microbacterium sp. CH12i]
MNSDHSRFADWDAAYVLGSLSPADRALYERHLAQCGVCRAAVAEIAPTLGLLSRVLPERAQALLDTDAPSPGPDPTRRNSVIELGEARARRRRTWWVGGIAAAVALVIGIAAVPIVSSLIPAASQTVALEPVEEAPLTASVALTEVAWGTRIDMTCRYEKNVDAPPDGWGYALVVIATDGTESELSSWRAYPESTTRLSAGTALDASAIAAVEIRAVATGTVLMRSDPGDFGPE